MHIADTYLSVGLLVCVDIPLFICYLLAGIRGVPRACPRLGADRTAAGVGCIDERARERNRARERERESEREPERETRRDRERDREREEGKVGGGGGGGPSRAESRGSDSSARRLA